MDSAVTLLCLTLAAYRLTRLLVKDDFPPVLWVRDRLAGGWRPLTLREREVSRLPVMDHDGQSATIAGLGAVQQIDGVLHRYVRRKSWSPYWLADLISCPWCVSAYVAGAVVAGTWWAADLPAPVLWWLAVWGATALLASQEWA